MSRWQKIAVFVILLLILAVILLTWGSVGSSVMTLALILALGFLLLRKLLLERSGEDYWMED